MNNNNNNNNDNNNINDNDNNRSSKNENTHKDGGIDDIDESTKSINGNNYKKCNNDKDSSHFTYLVIYVAGVPHPFDIQPLWSPGATFDKNYNSHFKPIPFKSPPGTKKVLYV